MSAIRRVSLRLAVATTALGLSAGTVLARDPSDPNYVNNWGQLPPVTITTQAPSTVAVVVEGPVEGAEGQPCMVRQSGTDAAGNPTYAKWCGTGAEISGLWDNPPAKEQLDALNN